MQKVLKISYYYPPHDCTASLEASKFTKFLPDHGWMPIVVTAESDYPPTLPLEIPRHQIHRTRQFDVNRLPKLIAGKERVEKKGFVTDDATLTGKAASRLGYLYRQLVDFPDAQIGWYPFALREARRLVQLERPDVILSSAWPVTNHLVAARIASISGLPWFADFRDLWTRNHDFQRVRPLRPLERRLERRVMKEASALSSPSESWSRTIESDHGKPAYVLPNGFDPADYPDEAPLDDRFVLTYTGVLYPDKQDPLPMLHAISAVRERGVIDQSNFELQLVGRYMEYLRPMLAKLEIEELASICGMVSHSEALVLQKRSSALLFLLWTRPEGKDWYSAKLYEYLGAGRPILAIGAPETAAAKLLLSVEAGEVTNDVETATDILERWIKDPVSRPSPNKAGLDQFHWSYISRRLAELLDDVVNRSV